MDEYARFAGIYDTVLNPFLDNTRRYVARICAEAGYASVLDLCCGTARQAVFLHAEGIACTGIDASPHMLAQARKLTSPRVPLVMGDGARLPFADTAFDAAVIAFALHEKPLPVAEAMLAEAFRVAPELVVVDFTMAERNLELAGQWLMQVPEILVGGEHYQNYREWMRAGALQGAVYRSGCRIISRERLFYGGAAVMRLAMR